ncbi:MAG: hypothetical protein KAJ18_10320 [Candidatus Omnitrophica bacterium]|nr:hypothetical protein [Candidatus Omnitrophota bacterium]
MRKIISSILIVVMLSGCAATMSERDLRIAERVDPSIIQYRKVLNRSRSAGVVILDRIEKIPGNKTPVVFLVHIPLMLASLPIGIVLALCGVEQKQYKYVFELQPEYKEGVDAAIRQVLPAGVKASTALNISEDLKINLVVRGHLLEGKSPDSEDPYVRGNYGSHDALTRLSQYRTARIIKALVFDKEIDDIYKDIFGISVYVRHGVRTKIVHVMHGRSIPGGSSNSARTIYSIYVPVQKVVSQGEQVVEEEIVGLWDVFYNDIPNLHFSTSYY